MEPEDLIIVTMILLGAVVCFAVLYFLLGSITRYDQKGEHITEQQYREQSLQYLEDIRNALAPVQ